MIPQNTPSSYDSSDITAVAGVAGEDAMGFFFQAEDGIRDADVTGVQTCALPISLPAWSTSTPKGRPTTMRASPGPSEERSEEHTSELQSRPHLVCRLLLEKKKRAAKTVARRTTTH